MEWKSDWEQSKRRLDALWHGEIIDRCCIAVPVLRQPQARFVTVQELERHYFDPETILRENIEIMQNSYYGGDSFPCIWPNFGTTGHAKYFKGMQMKLANDTIWLEPDQEPDEELAPPEYDPNNRALKRELDILAYLAQEAHGRYFVAMPDNCGVLDALAQMRTPEQLLVDLLTQPDAVKEALLRIQEGLLDSLDKMFAVVKDNCLGGSVHGWMYTIHPGRHVQMQVDTSVMLSAQMYGEFCLPELVAVSNHVDAAIYHLDGQEQIRHLPYILGVEGIKMIQWTPVAGQPKTSTFISTFRRIQQAGKGLVLFPEPDEIETLLTELSSKGLYLIVRNAKARDEADALVKMAEKLSHE